MLVFVDKTRLNLKIRSINGWVEIRIREWEDFGRIYYLLNL